MIAPLGQWLGQGKSPSELAQEAQAAHRAVALAASLAAKKREEEERERNRVFAKSCLRDKGCTDAGDAPEPHTNFAAMAFFQAIPADDPATDAETPQHAQSTKKKQPAEKSLNQRNAAYSTNGCLAVKRNGIIR
ncbi:MULTISPECIES: hypothetical protein [Tenebrionibacter/Tenebrionicola group]|uniref:hypothetical protein n=1 Tax=Tenebrionibacter/Tenebrionicola group TaxID=2969848 RepID=UPI0037D9DD97